MTKINELELLDYIDPAQLDYSTWLAVGMALKEAGHTACRLGMLGPGETRPGTTPESAESGIARRPTLSQLNNCQTGKDRDGPLPVKNRLCPGMGCSYWRQRRPGNSGYGLAGGTEIVEPELWDPAAELIRYLETLFEASGHVGYVTESWEKTAIPTHKGCWDRQLGSSFKN